MKPCHLLALCLAAVPSVLAQNQAEERYDGRVAAFSVRDSDGDGYLSKDEFLGSAKSPERAEDNFKKWDKNGDGKLSLDEFAPKPKQGGS
ncbi:MAG TPA: EF-hand domain-containing protein [Terrimicrobiaceae bacterium]|nr:EF-hand domain-containing protein [Terrimicrobiaceae bacterium]